jgi:diguanylate cyclase
MTGSHARQERHRRFVDRIHGTVTSGIAIAAPLYRHGAPVLAWVALALNVFAWPEIAHALARRSADPHRAELRNLTFDSICGGAWIAMMRFDLLPSVLLAVLQSADKVGVGGWKLLVRTLPAQAAACALTWSLLGFPFDPRTTMVDLWGALPFLVVYPIALSAAAYELSRTVVRQNRMLDQLSRTDPLTGLANRLHWEGTVAVELQRVSRSGRPSTLLMLDIDNFKQINDRYGHQVGDDVLRRIAGVLRESIRTQDTPGRFGGDEFGVVLCEATHDGAMEVAERIRAAIAALRFAQPELRCAVSIGIASATPRMRSTGEWERAADAALYRAKQHGRNRVVHGDDPVAGPALTLDA